MQKIMRENEDLARNCTSNDGKIFSIPYLIMDKRLSVFTGSVMRTDWLKKMDTETQKNADELYNVIKKFK